MGPGRTGVKGVIRDQHEAATLQAERRAREMDEVRRRMERANLGGKTFLEEEAEKEALDGERGEKRIDVLGLPRPGRFGHLREVGRGGFVSAVEREDRGVWVVVHLYESVSALCFVLWVLGWAVLIGGVCSRWIGVMLLMRCWRDLRGRTLRRSLFVRARLRLGLRRLRCRPRRLGCGPS